ncbi:hypothetical protein [Wolbachia endosymbiont of Dactylopius coccus]
MALGSEYKNEEIINKLIELEVIKDKDALKKSLIIDGIGQPEEVSGRKEENKPGTCFNDPTVDKQLQRSCQTISS